MKTKKATAIHFLPGEGLDFEAVRFFTIINQGDVFTTIDQVTLYTEVSK